MLKNAIFKYSPYLLGEKRGPLDNAHGEMMTTWLCRGWTLIEKNHKRKWTQISRTHINVVTFCWAHPGTNVSFAYLWSRSHAYANDGEGTVSATTGMLFVHSALVYLKHLCNAAVLQGCCSHPSLARFTLLIWRCLGIHPNFGPKRPQDASTRSMVFLVRLLD